MAARKKRKKRRSDAERAAPEGAEALGPAPGVDRAAFVRAKRWATSSAVGLLVGVALVATGDTLVGPWITVASMAFAIAAAHTLGRCGPDPGETPDARADR